MPRKPSKLTRLGRLRIIAGCDGKALAADAGISYQLIKMIERNTRTLTEETAKKVSRATGVSGEWLLGKGPKTKPTTDRSYSPKFAGELFTKGYYDERRAVVARDESLSMAADAADFCRVEAAGQSEWLRLRLESILRIAVRVGEQNKVLDTVERCFRALDKLEKKIMANYPDKDVVEINKRMVAARDRRRQQSVEAPPPIQPIKPKDSAEETIARLAIDPAHARAMRVAIASQSNRTKSKIVTERSPKTSRRPRAARARGNF